MGLKINTDKIIYNPTDVPAKEIREVKQETVNSVFADNSTQTKNTGVDTSSAQISEYKGKGLEQTAISAQKLYVDIKNGTETITVFNHNEFSKIPDLTTKRNIYLFELAKNKYLYGNPKHTKDEWEKLEPSEIAKIIKEIETQIPKDIDSKTLDLNMIRLQATNFSESYFFNKDIDISDLTHQYLINEIHGNKLDKYLPNEQNLYAKRNDAESNAIIEYIKNNPDKFKNIPQDSNLYNVINDVNEGNNTQYNFEPQTLKEFYEFTGIKGFDDLNVKNLEQKGNLTPEEQTSLKESKTKLKAYDIMDKYAVEDTDKLDKFNKSNYAQTVNNKNATGFEKTQALLAFIDSEYIKNENLSEKEKATTIMQFLSQFAKNDKELAYMTLNIVLKEYPEIKKEISKFDENVVGNAMLGLNVNEFEEEETQNIANVQEELRQQGLITLEDAVTLAQITTNTTNDKHAVWTGRVYSKSDLTEIQQVNAKRAYQNQNEDYQRQMFDDINANSCEEVRTWVGTNADKALENNRNYVVETYSKDPKVAQAIKESGVEQRIADLQSTSNSQTKAQNIAETKTYSTDVISSSSVTVSPAEQKQVRQTVRQIEHEIDQNTMLAAQDKEQLKREARKVGGDPQKLVAFISTHGQKFSKILGKMPSVTRRNIIKTFCKSADRAQILNFLKQNPTFADDIIGAGGYKIKGDVSAFLILNKQHTAPLSQNLIALGLTPKQVLPSVEKGSDMYMNLLALSQKDLKTEEQTRNEPPVYTQTQRQYRPSFERKF